MKKSFGLRAAMLGIGLSISAIAPAQAQLVAVTPAFSCDYGGAMQLMNPDALDCSGAWDGNNLNQQANVLAELQAAFGNGPWSYIGTSNGATPTNAFASAGTGSTGTLTFASPIYGLFALSLKAANQFSLYLFDGGTAGLAQISYYSTIGTSINGQLIPQNLSHASLYGIAGNDPFTPDVVPTPEPASMVLMMTGLGAIALVRRRRRQV